MCHVWPYATNCIYSSGGVRNDDSGVVFDRTAGEKGHRKFVNTKDFKPKRKVDCWNRGRNRSVIDCKKLAKKEGDKKGKVDATLRDYDKVNQGDGIIITCYKNGRPEYCQNDNDDENSELEDKNDSIPDSNCWMP